MFSEKCEKLPVVLTISELNQKTSRLLEAHFSFVWVAGEISNFKRYASGHCYFSLKDQHAQIRCVMFRHKAQRLEFLLQDGMEVEVLALPTIYATRGDFQLDVEHIRRAGLGALFTTFETLKAKLQDEGLFAAGRKCTLPRFPRSVGIVSSLQGAAIQDMLTTLRRRFPGLQIIIYPTMVQGIQAAPEVLRAIQQASARCEVDVLIVGRGGGSIEDLWAFNDERVARSIVAAPMPVVSAVGHETDFTIADFVADVRAPTPTAAAELVSPDQRVWLQRLVQYRTYLTREMRYYMTGLAQRIDLLNRQLISPVSRLSEQRVRLTHLSWRLHQSQMQYLQQKQQQCAYMRGQLMRGVPRLTYLKQRLYHQQQQLRVSMDTGVDRRQYYLRALAAKISSFDPARILARGYSLVTDQQGHVIRSTQVLEIGASISLQLAAGSVKAQVTELIDLPIKKFDDS